MRFSRLHLENWRNFTHVDIPLQQRMFLIGANATGKSNLLDVFRFLQEMVRIGGGFQKAIIDRGGVSNLRSFAAQGSPNIVIDVHIAKGDKEIWRYYLAVAEDDQNRPIVKEEKVWKSGVLLLDRPDEQDSEDKKQLNQTRLEQSSVNREFREIADFFATIRYYHIVPELVREPERMPEPAFDPYGRDFIAQIVSLPKRTQNARLRLIQKALRAAVPQFQKLQVYKDSYGIPHLRGKFEHWQSPETWQTEADFSDGTLRLIGFLWALLDEGGPLLLEKPELSLHQDIVWHLPGIGGYIQIRRDRQILLSTHSQDLLRDESIAPDEVLILEPAQEGTKVVVGEEIATVRHLTEAGLTAAETTIPHTRPPEASKLSYFWEVA